MPSDQPRFPLGYALAAMLPLAPIAVMSVAASFASAPDRMAIVMVCSLLIGPLGAVVTGWGVYRLWRGERKHYPALSWLIFVPALAGVAGLVMG